MIYDDQAEEQNLPDLLEDDTDALVVSGFDVRNVVFIMPLGAPLPNELEASLVPTGTLYQRIHALDKSKWEDGNEFAFVPVAGSELLALERAWRALVTAKKVVVLMEIPAARYDVLFTQAARQIGLPTVEWPAISDALAERARTRQRTRDAEPWTEELPTGEPEDKRVKPRRKLPRAADEDDLEPPPPAEEDE